MKINAVAALITRLRRDKRGSMAIMFGVLLAPLMLLAGSSLDYSSASGYRSQLQSATDAAALTGASVEPWDENLCRERAESVFEGMFGENARLGDVTPQILCSTSGVSVSVETQMRTTLMSVVGFSNLPLGAQTEIVCGGADGSGDGDMIGWDTGGSPNLTRVLTVSQQIWNRTVYFLTTDGHPIIRLDNPHDEPATITVNAAPGGQHTYTVPHRGQFHVPFPYVVSFGEQVVFTLVEGPEPHGHGTATWDGNFAWGYSPQGEPFYADAEDEPRTCVIAS